MMLHVKKMSQDLDLDTGAVSNFVLLQLPNGGLIRALVDEEAALAITNCHVLGADAPRPMPPSSYVAPSDFATSSGSPPADDAPLIFGGDAGGDSPLPAPPVQRARSVGRDEYGYPVVRGGSGVDPGEISTSGGQDEDGVGQV